MYDSWSQQVPGNSKHAAPCSISVRDGRVSSSSRRLPTVSTGAALAGAGALVWLLMCGERSANSPGLFPEPVPLGCLHIAFLELGRDGTTRSACRGHVDVRRSIFHVLEVENLGYEPIIPVMGRAAGGGRRKPGAGKELRPPPSDIVPHLICPHSPAPLPRTPHDGTRRYRA